MCSQNNRHLAGGSLEIINGIYHFFPSRSCTVEFPIISWAIKWEAVLVMQSYRKDYSVNIYLCERVYEKERECIVKNIFCAHSCLISVLFCFFNETTQLFMDVLVWNCELDPLIKHTCVCSLYLHHLLHCGAAHLDAVHWCDLVHVKHELTPMYSHLTTYNHT